MHTHTRMHDVGEGTHAIAHMWRTEENFVESILLIGSRDRTTDAKLLQQALNPLRQHPGLLGLLVT